MGRIYQFIKEKPLLVIVPLFLAVVVLAFLFVKVNSAYVVLEERENKFELISPSIAWMETEDFLKKQETYNINYRELKVQILKELKKDSLDKYGVYFEDLTTGAWIGINEKEQFLPMSLFKVPLMIVILKKVEEGSLHLNQTVTITADDLDVRSGDLFSLGVGSTLTIKELLETMIQKSDNTAMQAISKNFASDEDYLRAISMMGLPLPSDQQAVSPKEYSNIFRALYFSTYLRRSFSNTALTILQGTIFDSQLPSGIPKDIKISHKVGFDFAMGYYHDCGIIYKPEHPYLLCIMSKENTLENANKMIGEISRIVYEYSLV
jgi:beta-lactamase class A